MTNVFFGKPLVIPSGKPQEPHSLIMTSLPHSGDASWNGTIKQ